MTTLIKKVQLSFIKRIAFCTTNKHNWSNQFGSQYVENGEIKKEKVRGVFETVSSKYDLMNDLMSFGIHRFWKNQFVKKIKIPEGDVLDVASGTADIAFRILEFNENVKVTCTDINEPMLKEGYKKALNKGLNPFWLHNPSEKDLLKNTENAQKNPDNHRIFFKVADAENLPFPDNAFDCYAISFGLRNTSDVHKTLSEALRVLKSGGRFLCLEFSTVQNPVLRAASRLYNSNVLPLMGSVVAGDYDAYKYLAESIENFISQEELEIMMAGVGFKMCSYENFMGGVVAVHSGFKL